MVTSAARRTLVTECRLRHQLSERRACRYLGIHRPLLQYQPRRVVDPGLLARLGELAEARPRWGSPRLTWRLRREGWPVNHKRIERLVRVGRLLVGQRRRRRKRGAQARVPVAVPTRPNERWSMDFVRDTTAEGRPYRIWALVDDATRECPLLLADRSLPGPRVVEALDLLLAVRGRPRAIVCDNGSEFTSLTLSSPVPRSGRRDIFTRVATSGPRPTRRATSSGNTHGAPAPTTSSACRIRPAPSTTWCRTS